jgi:hypothetical protein
MEEKMKEKKVDSMFTKYKGKREERHPLNR